MSRLVTVAIHQEEIWFVAKCLENSVTSQGETMEEALANLREALELFFEDEGFPKEFPKTFITTLEIAI